MSDYRRRFNTKSDVAWSGRNQRGPYGDSDVLIVSLEEKGTGGKCLKSAQSANGTDSLTVAAR
jgi:hypothetical protein